MNIKIDIRKLSYRLGLSEEKRDDISDLLCERPATIICTQQTECHTRDLTEEEYMYANEMLIMPLFRAPAITYPVTHTMADHSAWISENFYVTVQFDDTRQLTTYNDCLLYHALYGYAGKHVKLGMREILERTLNYFPPDFDKKVVVAERKLASNIEYIKLGNRVLYQKERA